MKILIIRLSSLGDIVLTQSVCAWLRKRYPLAEIDFLAKSQYLELVSLMGCELKPIPYEKTLAAHLALKAKHYDLVLDLHNKAASWLIRLAAAGKKTLVYDKQRAKRKRIVAGDRSLGISSTLHLYRSALLKLSKDVQLEAPALQVPDIAVPLPMHPAHKNIMLFPGAAHYTKRYPLNSYKAVLQKSPAHYFYWLAGSAAERELCAELHLSLKERSCNVAGELSFGQILKAIEASAWVISSDSGPMHLAASLAKPQIAIFGATHPRLGFAPQNPHAKILINNLDCQPCSLHGGKSCPLGHFECMLGLSPDRILALLQGSN